MGRKRLKDLTGTDQDFSGMGAYLPKAAAVREDLVGNGWELEPDSKT